MSIMGFSYTESSKQVENIDDTAWIRGEKQEKYIKYSIRNIVSNVFCTYQNTSFSFNYCIVVFKNTDVYGLILNMCYTTL